MDEGALIRTALPDGRVEPTDQGKENSNLSFTNGALHLRPGTRLGQGPTPSVDTETSGSLSIDTVTSGSLSICLRPPNVTLHCHIQMKTKFALHFGHADQSFAGACLRPDLFGARSRVALPRMQPNIMLHRLLIHSDVGAICRRPKPFPLSLSGQAHTKLMTDESIATTTRWQI